MPSTRSRHDSKFGRYANSCLSGIRYQSVPKLFLTSSCRPGPTISDRNIILINGFHLSRLVDFQPRTSRSSIHLVLINYYGLLFYQRGVSTVDTVLRVTWIRKTPGYDHLGADPTICLIYLILFIKYELRIVSKNEKQHSVAQKISDFFVPKIFFSIFFSDFHTLSRKKIMSFRHHLGIK